MTRIPVRLSHPGRPCPPAAAERPRNPARIRPCPFARTSPGSPSRLFALTLAGLVWLVLRGEERLGYSWHWRQMPGYFLKIVDGQWIAGPLLQGLGVTPRSSPTAWCWPGRSAWSRPCCACPARGSAGGWPGCTSRACATPRSWCRSFSLLCHGADLRHRPHHRGAGAQPVRGGLRLGGVPRRHRVHRPRPVGGGPQPGVEPGAHLPLRHPAAGPAPHPAAAHQPGRVARQGLGPGEHHRRLRPDHGGPRHHCRNLFVVRDLVHRGGRLPGAHPRPVGAGRHARAPFRPGGA